MVSIDEELCRGLPRPLLDGRRAEPVEDVPALLGLVQGLRLARLGEGLHALRGDLAHFEQVVAGAVCVP